MSELLSDGEEPTAPASGRLPRWVLAALLAVVVLICLGGTVTVVLVGGRLSQLLRPARPGDAARHPTVTIEACDFLDQPVPHAKVRFTLVNGDDVEQDFEVDLEVLDSAGKPVGRGTAAVENIDSGATATQEADVYLDLPGAAQCRVDGVR